MTPMQILMTALAYVVLADKKALPEERANLAALMGKHVTKKDLLPSQIQQLTSEAFDYAMVTPFEEFLPTIESRLRPAQIASILANMYEVMIVDGNIVAREKELIDAFYKFFDMDRRLIGAMREILMVKNDTTMFLRDDHPLNGRDFKFKFVEHMDIDP